MKYFTDPITGDLWHCSNLFNYAAVNSNGSLYVFENKPKKEELCMLANCRPGVGKWESKISQDLCVIQRDSFYKDWKNSMRAL